MALIEVKEKDILYTECKDYLLTSVVCDYGIFEKYIPYKYDRNPPKPEELHVKLMVVSGNLNLF